MHPLLSRDYGGKSNLAGANCLPMGVVVEILNEPINKLFDKFGLIEIVFGNIKLFI